VQGQGRFGAEAARLATEPEHAQPALPRSRSCCPTAARWPSSLVAVGRCLDQFSSDSSSWPSILDARKQAVEHLVGC
jgi:hypothetical protein